MEVHVSHRRNELLEGRYNGVESGRLLKLQVGEYWSEAVAAGSEPGLEFIAVGRFAEALRVEAENLGWGEGANAHRTWKTRFRHGRWPVGGTHSLVPSDLEPVALRNSVHDPKRPPGTLTFSSENSVPQRTPWE